MSKATERLREKCAELEARAEAGGQGDVVELCQLYRKTAIELENRIMDLETRRRPAVTRRFLEPHPFDMRW